MSPLGISNTQPRNFEAPRSAELIPAQIRETSNTFIALLNEYYVWLNKADLPTNILYSALTETDIDLVSAKHISNIAASIAKYIPNARALDRAALYKKIVKYYYNTRGSRESAYVFFRIFFDAIIEIIDSSNGALNTAIKLWLAQYVGSTNPSIPKHAELWRPFTYGIATDVDSGQWNIPFKALVHPIGFRYFHIVKLLLVSRNAWLDLNGELSWSHDNTTDYNPYPVMFGQMVPGNFGDMKFVTPGAHSPTNQNSAYAKFVLARKIVKLLMKETNAPRDTTAFQYLDTRPLNTWESIDYKNDDFFNISPIYKYRIKYSPDIIKTATLKFNTKLGYPTYLPGFGVSIIYSTTPINSLSDLDDIIEDPNKQYGVTNSLAPYINYSLGLENNITNEAYLTYTNQGSDTIIKAKGIITVPHTGKYNFTVFASNAFRFSIKSAATGFIVAEPIAFTGDYNNFGERNNNQRATLNKNGITQTLDLLAGDYLVELLSYNRANTPADSISIVSSHFINATSNIIDNYSDSHSKYILLGSTSELNPFRVKYTSTPEIIIDLPEFKNTITFADFSDLMVGRSMTETSEQGHTSSLAKIISINKSLVNSSLTSPGIISNIMDAERMSNVIPQNSLEALIYLTSAVGSNVKVGMTVHASGIPSGSKIKSISNDSIAISFSEPIKTNRVLAGDISFSAPDANAMMVNLSHNNLKFIPSNGILLRMESDRIIVTNNSDIKIGQLATNSLLNPGARVMAILGNEILLSSDNAQVTGTNSEFRFVNNISGVMGDTSINIFPMNLNLIPGMELTMSASRMVQANADLLSLPGAGSMIVSIIKDTLSDKPTMSDFKGFTVKTSKKLAGANIITVDTILEYQNYVELKLLVAAPAIFEFAPVAGDILTLTPPPSTPKPIVASVVVDAYSQNLILDRPLSFSFPGIATFAISQDYTT